MKFSSKLVAAAAAALFAQAAGAAGTIDQPSVILYGGGATLPADAYVGDSWLDAVPSRRLSNTLPPPAGSSVNANAVGKGTLFGAYALSTVGSTGSTANQKAGRVGVSYCQTGSGTGRGVITNTKNGTGICGDYASTPTGFSADTRKADFGASDAPLSQGDINNFNATTVDPLNANGASQNYGTLYTQPVQFPAVAGAVAVVYNNADLGKTQLNLTRADICGIFSGAITNWTQLSSHTPKITTPLPSKTIKVVYRSDSSGTTFSFSNFLSQVCPNVGVGTGTTRFYTANSFLGGTSASFAAGQFTVPGAIGSSGNGGIVNTVSSTDGAIGYAEVADAVDRAKRAGGSNLKTATVAYAADVAKASGTIAPGGADVACAGGLKTFHNAGTKPLKYSCPAVVYNKLDPAKNFLAKGVTAVAVDTTADYVLPSAVDTSTGRFTPAAATGLTNTGAVAGCVLLVPPSAYAESPTGATKTTSADYAIYPIKAVSYLLAYGTGNGAKTADLKSFLASPFDTTILGKVKTIGKTTGYAPLTVTVGGVATTMSTFINGCVRS